MTRSFIDVLSLVQSHTSAAIALESLSNFIKLVETVDFDSQLLSVENSLPLLVALHNCLMGNWLQYSWWEKNIDYSSQIARQTRELATALETLIEQLAIDDDRIDRRWRPIRAASATRGTEIVLSSRERLAIELFQNTSDIHTRIKSLTELRLIRDKRAQYFEFPSYANYRESRELAGSLDQAYEFLISLEALNEESLESFITAISNERADDWHVKIGFATLNQLCDFLNEYILNKFNINMTCESITREATLSVDVLSIFDGQNKIGEIMCDQRRSRINGNLNKTIPISRRICLLGHFQPAIALISVTHSTESDLLNFHEVLSVLHELGHALDHVLDKSLDLLNSGLNARPIDELEVSARWLELVAFQSDFFKFFEPDMSAELSKNWTSSTRGHKIFRYFRNLSTQIATAAFDINLYRLPVGTKGIVSSAFDRTKADFKWRRNISPELLIRLMDVTHINKYQCANHGYIWSHSIAEKSRNELKERSNEPISGLHDTLIGNVIPNPKDLAFSFINSIL